MFYVIFIDKSIKQITEEKYEKIIQATQTEAIGIEIGGGFYKFAAISKILPEADFLEQYPQYRKTSHQPYSEIKGNVFTRATNSKEKFLSGFRKVKPNATMQDLEEYYKPKKHEVKYSTWQEAKAAGVV